VKQRSAARAMAVFPDDTRFVLWCASQRQRQDHARGRNEAQMFNLCRNR